ncbi:hypothetical protein D3C85_1208370 [compost metagenome]
MQQTLTDFGVTAPGPFIGHHQLGNPQTVLVTELEQFDGAGEIVRQHHVAVGSNTGLGFGCFDDETAAHRVVRLLKQLAGFAEGCQRHGVRVVGQTLVEQQEIAFPVEGNRHLARERKLSGFAQGVNTAVDGGGIDTIRPLAHQAHDAGAVGGVTDAGCRQGAIEADLHAAHIGQQSLIDQRLGEGRRRAHRTNGMGTGRTDADFEEIENTDSHAKAYS